MFKDNEQERTKFVQIVNKETLKKHHQASFENVIEIISEFIFPQILQLKKKIISVIKI